MAGAPALVAAATCSGVGGGVLCVNVAADVVAGAADGTAAAPFLSIGAAVAAAADGNTIQVAGGTYEGNVAVLQKKVVLLGGFEPGFGARDLAAFETHIVGQGGDAAVALVGAGESRVEGFRISGGTGSERDLPWYRMGGGVYVLGGAPTVAHNIIEKNVVMDPEDMWMESFGGGLHLEESEASVLFNVIAENVAQRGGGMSVWGGAVTIAGNQVLSNEGYGDHGGGIYAAAPSLTINNNRVVGNVIGTEAGYGWGGGIILFGAETVGQLAFNVVTDNAAPTAGSGVFFDDGSSATMSHDLVYGNACPEIGGAGVYVDGYEDIGSTLVMDHVTVAGHGCSNSMFGSGIIVEQHSTVEVRNSILWGNATNGAADGELATDATSSISVSWSNVELGADGEGNIALDPMFAAPEDGDFHLRSAGGRFDPASGGMVVDATTSPCVDAGDPAAAFGDEPGENGGRANMGAFGNTAQASLTGETE